MKRPLLIGVVGGGSIGSAIVEYCRNELSSTVRVVGVYDIDDKKATIKSLGELINKSDLIIETASVEAAADVLEKSIKAKRDVVIMSTGGIIGRLDLLDLARKNGVKVYFPSGAICGIDGLKAASLAKIESVTLTTKKSVEGLRDAPYIKKKGIDLDSIEDEKVIFEGEVTEAVRAFPKNINVSATLSLAGVGVDNTSVRIVCSPSIKRNTHEIKIKGESGDISVKMENLPSPDNPKTSFLAVLSAIATVKGIVDSVRIGT